ncbi:hypothetical protein PoB_005184400 [Plakobranchus ocellatus]|uniref:Uncharacterized protein n=1 Tax=Plakobranchus ocellatus TaxID=259542 RepID=A0AAV4BYN1_9GAST|nr:hypothetical protein PoB_005184400 [Plakobranchus ocellatus]
MIFLTFNVQLGHSIFPVFYTHRGQTVAIHSGEKPFHIGFKINYDGESTTVSICQAVSTCKNEEQVLPATLPHVRTHNLKNKPSMLSQENNKDLQAILGFMPALDKQFKKGDCKLECGKICTCTCHKSLET